MNKDAVIAVLRAHQAELRSSACVMLRCSVLSRGEAGPKSDIDIAIEVDMERHPTVYDYVGMQQYIGGLFDVPVDVVDCEGLKPRIKERVTADLVPAY